MEDVRDVDTPRTVHDSVDAPTRRTRPGALRWVAAAVAGVLVAAVLVAVRAAGWVQGTPALVLAVVLLVLLPTARHLSGRLLLTGALALGWVQVMWWWRLPMADLGPLGDVGRAWSALAVVVGGLVAWVVAGPGGGGRARRLVPRVRLVDLFPLGAGAVMAATLSAYLTVRNAPAALSILIPGWDNTEHMDMAAMVHNGGAIISELPPGVSGDAWQYFAYPQGFHTVVAALSEIVVGPGRMSTETAVMMYTRGTALVMVIATVLVAAGICALPQFRDRPVIALPVVAVVTATYAFGPGVGSTGFGHTTFVLGVTMAAVTALIALGAGRVFDPLTLFAVGGALVGVAHTWFLLLAMAGPAAALLLLPLTRERFAVSRRDLLATALILLAVLGGSYQAFRIVRLDRNAASILTATGGLLPLAVGSTIAVVVAAIAAGPALLSASSGPGRDGGLAPGLLRRTAAASLVPLTGSLLALGIGYAQLRTEPELHYFFWKSSTGVLMVSVVLLAVTAGTLAAHLLPRAVSRRVRLVRTGIGVVLAAALTQCFGYAGPALSFLGRDTPVSPGLAVRLASSHVAKYPTVQAQRLLAAAPLQEQRPGMTLVYMPSGASDLPDSANANHWYRTLTGTWTQRSCAVYSLAPRRIWTQKIMIDASAKILDFSSTSGVVIAPDRVNVVRDGLRGRYPAEVLRTRILTW